jgi:hypothetical protein
MSLDSQDFVNRTGHRNPNHSILDNFKSHIDIKTKEYAVYIHVDQTSPARVLHMFNPVVQPGWSSVLPPQQHGDYSSLPLPM